VAVATWIVGGSCGSHVSWSRAAVIELITESVHDSRTAAQQARRSSTARSGIQQLRASRLWPGRVRCVATRGGSKISRDARAQDRRSVDTAAPRASGLPQREWAAVGAHSRAGSPLAGLPVGGYQFAAT
jgi:hypothetical protein